MNKPNFFLVGAPKSGTTALHQYLIEHPQIFAPKIKEPNFFAEDIPEFRNVKALREYENLYKHVEPAHKAIGDFSIMSLYSAVALQKIYEYNPRAKILAALRHPADLTHAFHSQMRLVLLEKENDFRAAWRARVRELSQPDNNGARIKALCYPRLGMLGEQVQRLYAIFPREQVLLIFYDDFVSDIKSVYESILKFLEVDPDNRLTFPRINENKENRFQFAAKLLMPAIRLQNRARSLFNFGALQKSKRLYRFNVLARLNQLNRRNVRREPLEPQFRAEMLEQFRDDINKLAELSGRNLDHWLE